MSSFQADAPRPALFPARVPIYYGWVTLAVAALAMVGTLPGRTQGLGLITEPLLKDLQLDRLRWAQINLWATLLGSLFCLGMGRLLDRFGSRTVLTATALLLGAVVLWLSLTQSVLWLAVLITLTRGLGQSALSVISISIVGQWFVKKLNTAMGVYSVLLSIGFMIAFPLVGASVQSSGWRQAWAGIGFALLLGLAPLSWVLMRRTPESCGIALDGEKLGAAPQQPETGATLGQALATPAFWVFALSSSVYGLLASGIALFNESILAERGFDAATYYRTLVITALTALAGNFLCGWLSNVQTQWHVAAWAVVMGLAGGVVIVIFFSFWSRAFGRAHLGKIQGAAQTLTVLASAIGPLLLAAWVTRTGSYATVFYVLAFVVGVLAVSAWLVRLPVIRPNEPSSVG
jgi:MFS family permease